MLDNGWAGDDVDPADTNGLFEDAIALLNESLSIFFYLSSIGCCIFFF
jgi:hypothetical protein